MNEGLVSKGTVCKGCLVAAMKVALARERQQLKRQAEAFLSLLCRVQMSRWSAWFLLVAGNTSGPAAAGEEHGQRHE